jgi:hypothetical protein
MKELPDPIETAERDVDLRKTEMQAQFDALQTRIKRQASSPKLIAGVIVGAVAFAYLLFRPGKGEPAKKGGTLPLLMQGAQTLLPLIGAWHAAREAESAKKTVSKATGTPPVPPGE